MDLNRSCHLIISPNWQDAGRRILGDPLIKRKFELTSLSRFYRI
jgi:hypothetical protein